MTIFDEEDCKELSEPYRPGKLREMSFANVISMVKEYRSLYGFYSDDLIGDYKADHRTLAEGTTRSH